MVIYSASGVPVIAIDVDDSSYRYREIMGDCKVYLEFALTMHVEILPGSFIRHQGEVYTLMTYQDVTIRHNRDFEYKATFEGPTARFRKYRVHNLVDGRLKFDYIAKPIDHLRLVVGNLCEREGAGAWEVGDCVDGKEVLVSYNHTRLDEAMNTIAEACGTEWEGAGGLLSLKKVEYNADEPLALAYGKNLGFKPGVGRLNYGEFGQIEKVYIQGSERNIVLKDYGSATLLLPKGLTFFFDGAKLKYTIDGTTYTEPGFDADKAVKMVTDANGFSVRLYDAPVDCNEDSLDMTEIYPKRVGTVTDVRYEYEGGYYTYAELIAAYPNLTDEEWAKVQVDVFDNAIPAALDFAECLIANDEPLTVIFQSGMLAGKEFNATFYKEPKTKTVFDGSGNPSTVQVKAGNRFELVKASIDGYEMPGGAFRPNASSGQDEYIVVNVSMPEAYICNYPSFEGAEIDALRASAKHLYENKDAQFTFKGEVDGLFAKRNWTEVGPKLILGGCVSFSHPSVQPDALVTRIKAIKDYINNPYSPEVTLSNETVKGGLSSRLSEMEGATEHVNRRVDDSVRYTRRSWRDAKESQEMLVRMALEEFTGTISPIAVNTMQMLVGSENLQYSFITSLTDMTPVAHNLSFDTYGRIVCPAAYIMHHTKGIDTVQADRPVTDYMRWSLTARALAFTDETKPYYLYIKTNRLNAAGTGTGEFIISEDPIAIEEVSGYWHFLYATIGAVVDGERSVVTYNGFTEITPGRITAYKIQSPDGNSLVIDALNSFFKMQKGNKFFKVDMTNGHDDIIFSGVMTQNKGGDSSPVTCHRGAYDATKKYYYGDEVSHNGSSWWHKGTEDTGPGTTAGVVEPGTNSAVWEQTVSKGTSGQGNYKSIVFKRSTTQPDTPTGGSYDNPVPSGWSDGIPSGDYALWMSTRIFTSDSRAPQQSAWTTPQQATDTSDIDFEYSSVANTPGNPTDNPANWSNDADETTIWMAVRKCSNGVWGSWEISKIKGEKGTDGAFKSTVFKRSNTAPSAPSGGTYASPVPSGWSDGIPNGTAIVWASSCTFYADDTSTGWSTPRQMTDTDTFDVEFAKMQANDAVPATPTDANRHGGSGTQIWFDPALDTSEDFTQMYWRAERECINGVWGDWTIVRIKGEKGDPGDGGINTAVVYLYKRAASAPTIDWNDTLTYSFANKALTSVPSGWSATIPSANGNPLYVTAATAASDGETDTIAKNEWATPVILAEDGADGLNSATVVLYKRASSAPTAPSSSLTYTFATGVLSGTGAIPLAGWSQTMPSVDGNPCYRIQATAVSTGDTDTILSSEWSEVAKILEDGASIIVQYSADGSSWHSSFVTGDIWMRTKIEGTSTWGDAVRIVGEKGATGDKGEYTDYSFAYSSSLTSANTTTAPSDVSTWYDAPPTPVSGKYLWMKIVTMTYNPSSASADQRGYVAGTAYYARIGGENGQQGAAGKSMRTYTYWTSAGWEGTGEYQGRDDSLTNYPTHKYQDQAIDPEDGYIYLCILTRSGNTYATSARPGLNSACWEKMSYYKAISTEALTAVAAFIKTLTVEQLHAMDSNGTERISIAGDTIDVKKSTGDTASLIHSGSLSGTSTISGITISSFSGSAYSGYGEVTAQIASLLGQTITIQRAGNTVVIPRITYEASYFGSHAAKSDLGGEIRAYLTDGTNKIAVFTNAVTLDSAFSETSQEKKISLPVGTWTFKVDLEVGLIDSSDRIYVAASRYSGSFSVTYPSGNDASKNEMAGDGFRSSWNGEGFQATSAGAKVIHGGIELEALGGAALNGLTAPVKFVFCTAYPSTLEANAFYLKFSQS